MRIFVRRLWEKTRVEAYNATPKASVSPKEHLKHRLGETKERTLEKTKGHKHGVHA